MKVENGFLLAQFIGFFAMAVNLSAWQIQKPRHIIMAYIPTNLLWTAQFMLLGGLTGAIASLLTVAKDTSLLIREDKRTYILIAFLSSNTLIASFFINTWFDILPILAVMFGNAGLFIPNNREVYARGTLIGCSLWLAYNILVGAWIGMMCSSLLILSILLGMARYEGWQVGRCYRTFAPSIARSLFIIPSWRTYP